MLNEILSVILKVVVIVLIGVVVLNPTAVGHWQAQRDVAYDSIWGEWVVDCDCTEILE
jgi:hypothetical protein